MTQTQNKLNESLKKQVIREFAQTITDLKDINEVTTFINDFFSEDELETFAKRLAVAYWLKKSRSAQNIKDNLKVTSATIASVQKIIDTNGIKLALKKMEAEEWANIWSEKIKKVIKK